MGSMPMLVRSAGRPGALEVGGGRVPAAHMQGSVPQDLERQHAHIGIMVEFSIALMSKLDGINRHSFNSFRLRVGEAPGRWARPGSGWASCSPCLLANPPGSVQQTVPSARKSFSNPSCLTTPGIQ